MPNAQDLINALLGGGANPEERAAVTQASQAAAQHLRRPDLPGIAYGSQPDVRAARDAGLVGVAGTIASAHPAAWPGFLLDALSSPTGAKDITALHPNTTAMTASGGELPPRLQELQRMIQEEQDKLSKLPPVYKKNTTGYGRNRTTNAEADIPATENRDRQARENIAKMQAEAQSIIHSRQTFNEVMPDWAKNAVRFGGPAASLLTSIPMGFFKPGLKSALYSTGYGGAEAIGAELMPELYDLMLPKDSPGYKPGSRKSWQHGLLERAGGTAGGCQWRYGICRIGTGSQGADDVGGRVPQWAPRPPERARAPADADRTCSADAHGTKTQPAGWDVRRCLA